MSYDSAITVFSPDGHLFQVEYAQEAVKRGNTAIGVCGNEIIVIAIEKKAVASLQISRTIRKICAIDKHLSFAYAGLTADARVLINRIRIACQEHALTYEDPPTVEYLAKTISKLKQKYTQSNGRRPFGISGIVAGFDPYTGKPHLFQTDPAGTYLEWKANVVGKNSALVLKFLEKKHPNIDLSDNDLVIMLAIESLMETVQPDGAFMDIAILRNGVPMSFLKVEEIDTFIKKIIERKEAEAESRRRK